MKADTSDDIPGLSLLGTPLLSPLSRDAAVVSRPLPRGLPFLVPAPGRLVVAPGLSGEAALIALRHGLELAWLLGLPGLPEPVAGLLAARTACLFRLVQPARRGAGEPESARWLTALEGELPDSGRLERAWEHLAAHQPAAGKPTPAMLALLADLWRLAGPVEHLLTTGGDTRLHLDPATGLNKYGCAPWPREVVGFSSCTASSVSPSGYAAAESCRRRVLEAAVRGGGARAALRAEAARTQAAILAHYDAGETAEALLAPSGTDATLVLMGLLAAEQPGVPLDSVLFSPSETGSGIPDVARGRHFADGTATGAGVTKGAAVAGFPPMALTTIALRSPNGGLRRPAEVGLACRLGLRAAVPGRRLVLHAIEGSKTGLSAPGPAFLERLAGSGMEVVVDACQARLAPERVRACLERGWPMVLTGSKFFGGPPFSGVILFPRARLERALAGPLPEGLAAYLGAPGEPLGIGDNLGLLLRWQAALAEMARFAALPPSMAAGLFAGAGRTLEALLAREPRFRLVPAAAPEAAPRTIFTLALRDPANSAGWLSPGRLQTLYRWMNADLSEVLPAGLARPVHIGQPVLVGGGPRGQVGGLRIAFGAGMAAAPDAARQAEAGLHLALAKLALVLEREAELAEADEAA